MKLKRILPVLAGIFVLMQVVRIDKFNPPVDPGIDFTTIAQAPAEIRALIKDACYDCHSHQTQYPWYSNVAPVSWWIKNHVNEGLEHFNFNTLGALDSEELDEALNSAAEAVEEHEMPLSSYTWVHPKARLSDDQRLLLAAWLANYSKKAERYGVGE